MQIGTIWLRHKNKKMYFVQIKDHFIDHTFYHLNNIHSLAIWNVWDFAIPLKFVIYTNTFQYPLSSTFGTVYLQRHSNGLLQKITLNEILPPLKPVTSMLPDVKNSLRKRFESSIFPPPPQSGIKIQGDVQTPLKKCPRQKYPRRGPCTLMPSQKDRFRPT